MVGASCDQLLELAFAIGAPHPGGDEGAAVGDYSPPASFPVGRDRSPTATIVKGPCARYRL